MSKTPHHALSAVEVRRLTAPGYYCDGNGLYLQIRKSGSKSWIVRTTVRGKRRDIGIGGLRYTSLAEARDKAIEIRMAARNGRDPIAERRAKRNAERHESRVPTFAAAARSVYDEREKTFRSTLHKRQWIHQLEQLVFPLVGAVRVDHITTAEILKVLKPIWLRTPETARRIKQRLKVILDWTKASGYRTGDNPVDDIERVLPKNSRTPQHFPALPYQDVPAFVWELRRDERVSGRLAFEFLILTASRTNEVIKAQWDEIDLATETWTRPAAHMKANREHRVPLTSRCIEILKAAKRITDGGPYIFPGMHTGRHLSKAVFHHVLQRMDRTGITPHGFRSSFRDWAEEHTHHAHRTIETCLAHAIPNKVEAAYLRTELFEKRRELMAAWERFATAEPTKKVVNIRGWA